MTWYFGYGANMSERVMQVRGIRFTQRERAWLDGWQRRFAKIANTHPDQGYATILPMPGQSVEGILYFCPDGLERLDEFEGVARDYYKRVTLPVRRESDITVQAQVYVAPPQSVMDGLRPSREYLDKLLAGRDLLSPRTVRELEQTEVWSPLD
jgi:cation transport regulator ChaC